MKKIIIGNKIYYTNIDDLLLIKKCIDFFSDGCTSYAISFYNLQNSVICKSKIDKLECYFLREFNFNYKFVSEIAKDINNSKELLKKGFDLIELL